jgi:glucokinase
MSLIDLSRQIAIGIDIGGTNTKFGLVNHRGEILAKGSIKTEDYKQVEDFIDALHANITPLWKNLRKTIVWTESGLAHLMQITSKAQ